jgi:hypothetical protein
MEHSRSNRLDRRREYLAAGASAMHEYERTGLAYAMKDVERYVLGITAGKKLRRPRPAKAARKKT